MNFWRKRYFQNSVCFSPKIINYFKKEFSEEKRKEKNKNL